MVFAVVAARGCIVIFGAFVRAFHTHAVAAAVMFYAGVMCMDIWSIWVDFGISGTFIGAFHAQDGADVTAYGI